jgi:hypothetical protein
MLAEDDPDARAAVYSALGIRPKYDPGRRKRLVEATATDHASPA